MVKTRVDIRDSARLHKLHRPTTSVTQNALDANSTFFCIDWGASFWRLYHSTLGEVPPPEPSLALYKISTDRILTGLEAEKVALLDLDSKKDYLQFQNLKAWFDLDSGWAEEAEKRLQERLKLPKKEANELVARIFEQWWQDRCGPYLPRSPPTEGLTFGVAHPAHFSTASVNRLRKFFERRADQLYTVVLCEESTAALHGSSHRGLTPGDHVLVVDGGKSTIVQQESLEC